MEGRLAPGASPESVALEPTSLSGWQRRKEKTREKCLPPLGAAVQPRARPCRKSLNRRRALGGTDTRGTPCSPQTLHSRSHLLLLCSLPAQLTVSLVTPAAAPRGHGWVKSLCPAPFVGACCVPRHCYL